MEKTNLPILYENVMSGLPSDFARDAFLWATDQFRHDPYAYKAEAFAREADHVIRTFKHLVGLRQMLMLKSGGILLNEEQEKDLVRFCQARFANYKLGGNVKTSMPDFEQ
jgi:hypothetical protein